MQVQPQSRGKQSVDSNEQDDMSFDQVSQKGSATNRHVFSMEMFEQPKQRMIVFMRTLGEAAKQPANLEKYRSELPSMKSQLLYGSDAIMSIIDSMIRKARSTQKLKRNWSKYDLIAMFWTIEKFNILYGKKTVDYVRKCYIENEQDWMFIASVIPGKQRYACLFKWLNLKMHSKTIKQAWSETESELLLKIVAQRRTKGQENMKCHWSVVSHRLYLSNTGNRVYRTAKQCRERWSCTNPDVKKDLWNKKQDIQLLKSYLSVGKKWAMISRQLRARTENAIKNRFQLLEKKISNKAKKQPQQSLKGYIARYIQELQVEEYINQALQIKIEELPLNQTNHLLVTTKLQQQAIVFPVISKSSPPQHTEQPHTQASHGEIQVEKEKEKEVSRQATNMKFCRMTDVMLRSMRKELVPAVFEQQLMILKPQNTTRPKGWTRFIPDKQIVTTPSAN